MPGCRSPALSCPPTEMVPETWPVKMKLSVDPTGSVCVSTMMTPGSDSWLDSAESASSSSGGDAGGSSCAASVSGGGDSPLRPGIGTNLIIPPTKTNNNKIKSKRIILPFTYDSLRIRRFFLNFFLSPEKLSK